jgi:hypothetical protein
VLVPFTISSGSHKNKTRRAPHPPPAPPPAVPPSPCPRGRHRSSVLFLFSQVRGVHCPRWRAGLSWPPSPVSWHAPPTAAGGGNPVLSGAACPLDPPLSIRPPRDPLVLPQLGELDELPDDELPDDELPDDELPDDDRPQDGARLLGDGLGPRCQGTGGSVRHPPLRVVVVGGGRGYSSGRVGRAPTPAN